MDGLRLPVYTMHDSRSIYHDASGLRDGSIVGLLHFDDASKILLRSWSSNLMTIGAGESPYPHIIIILRVDAFEGSGHLSPLGSVGVVQHNILHSFAVWSAGAGMTRIDSGSSVHYTPGGCLQPS